MQSTKNKIKYEFHINKNSREKYKINDTLFSIRGELIIGNFNIARELTNKLNEERKKEGKADQLITAGLLNAAGLVHEILHHILTIYEENENPGVYSKSLDELKHKIGEKELNKIFVEFINEFPPNDVYKRVLKPEEYLIGTTEEKSNKEIILQELLLLHLQNNNPGTSLLNELFSDKNLSLNTKYLDLIEYVEEFFLTEKPFGKDNLPLPQFLREPAVNNPHNLEGQLDYILQNWGVYVYDKFYKRILTGQDLIREDVKLFIHHGGGEKGTPPVPIYDKERLEEIKDKIEKGEKLTQAEKDYYYSEPEKFTEDIDWMPEVVMIAKNAFVWLDQLSKKYQREIKRLDQIPDEELDRIASWNFNSLWLIGIWERSSASRKIKHLTGNIDAAASAYSLYDYVIANELGGEEAFKNLKDRASARGIRIASDMVPNHTGIHSKWVVEKPDYFLQRENPPYPSYSFNGPDLSDDERIEVRIEDKYYSREDASVVFQRKDSWTGDTRYIYHGNDGTHMPWNDTAQLNLLNPEVRESLIQTIMHVARKTPIIRFDAAMTLAKKHYQRLWFPKPGTGGAIPSRSDYAMTQEEFNNAFPEEFWREVVDRINVEMPNTLLLAEAFWLMEGYFVRSLGMHRVYNSAFMHMLMKEENDKYRDLIKNTLEFNPEILKRYVNFMSNPDEETAINQFGKGDKYFGVLLLMVTMPGLPMFAHGQIEGYSEKYGMEYKRAYYDEQSDENLVSRHEYEIFPLLRKRYLFSHVKNYQLYNFIDDYGNVINDVIAYSNKTENEKGLIIFNNSYTEHKGTIKYTTGKVPAEGKNIETKTLGEALDIKNDNNVYYIFRDHKTNLQHIYSGSDLYNYGLHFALRGYEYKIFIDFYEVYDTEGKYRQLSQYIGTKGVRSIEDAMNELNLAPVHSSFNDLFIRENVDELKSKFIFPGENDKLNKLDSKLPEKFQIKCRSLIDEINKLFNIPVDSEVTLNRLADEFNSLRILSGTFHKEFSKKNITKWMKQAANNINLPVTESGKAEVISEMLFPVLLLKIMNVNQDKNGNDLYSKLKADKFLFEIFDKLNHPAELISEEIKISRLIINKEVEEPVNKLKDASVSNNKIEFVNKLFESDQVKNFVSYNVYEGAEYFNKERFEELLDWIFTLGNQQKTLNIFKDKSTKSKKTTLTEKRKSLLNNLKNSHRFIIDIKEISGISGYRIDELKNNLTAKKKPGTRRKSIVKKEKRIRRKSNKNRRGEK